MLPASTGLLSQLANVRREMLPSSVNKPWAGSNRYKISELPQVATHGVHRREATPGRFTLTTFLCTLQDATSGKAFIDTLQHSILGTWLTFTQAGVPPASHQTISSPHVHRFVLPRSGVSADQYSIVRSLTHASSSVITRCKSSTH